MRAQLKHKKKDFWKTLFSILLSVILAFGLSVGAAALTIYLVDYPLGSSDAAWVVLLIIDIFIVGTAGAVDIIVTVVVIALFIVWVYECLKKKS